MSSLRIGFDLDGVLVNFIDGYTPLLTAQTGIKFPPVSATWPPIWYFDRAAGVTKPNELAVWAQITSPRSRFWKALDPLPGGEEILQNLHALSNAGHQVYFITTRPGLFAKRHTEEWLEKHGFPGATVLIAENEPAKGLMAKALKLDLFVDDKPENCEHVVAHTKTPAGDYPCEVWLVDAPYNRNITIEGAHRVTNVLGRLERFVAQELDAAA